MKRLIAVYRLLYKELIKLAEERGIYVEDLVILAISKRDPQSGIRIRVELAKKYFSEAEDYLKKVIRYNLSVDNNFVNLK